MRIALHSGNVAISTEHGDLATVTDKAKWKITVSRTALKDRTAEQIHDLAVDLERVAKQAGYAAKAPDSK